jgi:tape measure domain-containing protein
MTKRIEREVTALDFDARGFKRGVANTLRDLASLKKGLQLDGAAQGFAGIERAANNIDFSQMSSGIDKVAVQFNALRIIATTTLAKITSAAIDAGKNLFDKAFVDPIKTGLEEYELQINAVQTILANTSMKGTTLGDVNAALDELNEYADLTIYNFAQMTDNIGKFTAAGVDLDTSVSAIKGIANLAAVSGSNSQQASTAMYQLSQAIASGTVKLMDWNSVVNAGMGGQVFQDLLMDIGATQDMFQDMDFSAWIEEAGGFRASLQEGWITSEVMLKALEVATGDLNRAQLENLGLTEEQVDKYLEFGATAQDAATKIKTLTQLGDTMAEAIQSGWAQSFRIIIGDFEEAKNVFGAISEVFSGVIEESARSRNSILNVWDARGGRFLLIEAIIDGFTALFDIIGLAKDALEDVFEPLRGADLYNITQGLYNLVQRFKMGEDSAKNFQSIIRGLASILDIAFMLLQAILKPILSLVGGMSEGSKSAFEMAANLGDLLFALRNAIKESEIFDRVVTVVVAGIKLAIAAVRDFVTQLLSMERVRNIIDYLKSLGRPEFTKVFDVIKKALSGVLYAVGAVALGIKYLYDQFMSLDIVQKTIATIQSFDGSRLRKFIDDMKAKVPDIKARFQEFADKLREVGENFRQMRDDFVNSDAIQALMHYISTFDGRRWKSFTESFQEGFAWVDRVKEGVGELGVWIENLGTKLWTFLTELGAKSREAFQEFIKNLGEADGEINFDGLIGALNVGLIAAIGLALKKLFSGSWIQDLLDNYLGPNAPLIKSITDAFGALESALTAWQTNLKADTLIKIAGAVAIVTASAVALTMVDQEKLIAATIAIGVMVAELVGGARLLGGMNLSGISTAGLTVLGLASALIIMAGAVEKFGQLDPDILEQGLINAGYAIAGLVAAVKTLSIGPMQKGVVTASIAMGVMSASLMVMAKTVTMFGGLDPTVITQGLLAVTTMIIQLSVALKGLGTGTTGGPMIAAAVAMGIISYALQQLATTVLLYGLFDTGQVAKGMVRIGALLAGMAAYFKVTSEGEALAAGLAVMAMAKGLSKVGMAIADMSDLDWDEMLQGLTGLGLALAGMVIAAKAMTGTIGGSVAILAMAGAIAVLAWSIKSFAGIEWETVWKGLVAVGVAIAGLAIAGSFLGPVIIPMLGVAAALALIGLSALGVGLGIKLAVEALIKLAETSEDVKGLIVDVGEGIMEVLPGIGTAVADMFSNFILTIYERMPEILEAGKEAFLTLVDSIAEAAPHVIKEMIRMLLDLLKEIAAKAPEFFQAGWDILIAFLTGIRDNIKEVVEIATEIVVQFIGGLEENVDEIIDAGFRFVATFAQALADALEEHLPGIIDGFKRAGIAVVEGFINGLGARARELAVAAANLGIKAIESLDGSLKSESPSKETHQRGVWAAQGLINGMLSLVSKVRDAAEQLSAEVQNGIDPVFDTINASLQKDPSFKPIITPVVDMSVAKKDLSTLSKGFSLSGKAASLAGSLRGTNTQSIPATNEQASGVQFVQNNYSPKALNRGEIYRKTKMLVGKLST